jgi:hypothetical protein
MFLKVSTDDGFLRIDEPQVKVALKHDEDPLDGWIDRHNVRRLAMQQPRTAPEDAARDESAFEKNTTFHIVSILFAID